MYCLRWWIPLFLCPFPKTSPFFLVLFLLSFAIHSKPCMYCALIITGLITTSGNWYSSSSDVSHQGETLSSNASETTRVSHSWLDFGTSGGSGFWRPIARPDDVAVSTSSEVAHFRIPLLWTRNSMIIPKRFFLGLGSHGGLGVWVDLSSGNTASLSPDQISNAGVHSASSKHPHYHKVEL